MKSRLWIFTKRLALVIALFTWPVSCETVSDVGATIGQVTGTLSPQEADSIRRVGSAVGRTFEDITPEQEYFIGRAVSATILDSYSVYDNPEATRYLNLLGQALAMASDKPVTFGGYRFLILDSDEINAFAAPGGFIFVSRGMLRLCQNEDELAAVLAHEIGHVQHAHGLRAIKGARLTSAFTILAIESARTLGSAELADLVDAFEGAITDVSNTLMVNGYSRRLEREADEAAVTIMRRVGYDPRALVRMLEAMDAQLEPGGLDFAKTHPAPTSRIRDIVRIRGFNAPAPPVPEQRMVRFQQAMAGI